MPLDPIELLTAAPWQRVTFTTYALSLSFFEAVALDGLVRGGASEAVVLSDASGVRASLGELGAQRVGKDYQVEPIMVSHGVFHPKITVLWSPEACHVVVGSGNLTFGGWGGNCEVLEHLNPSFAATAIRDTADFFEQLATSDRVRHAMAHHCKVVAADLRAAWLEHPENRDIRLLHSMGTSIADQLAVLAQDLGGATQLIAAAPYWDDGSAIADLCRKLGLSRVHVHAHRSGCVAGPGTSNWPKRSTIEVIPVCVDALDDPDERRLHGKAFEVLCRRGRIVMSGSANASGAALGERQNIEACVARIQRDRTAGWSFAPATVPVAEPPSEMDDGEEVDHIGVLRAVLEGGEVAGAVITPRMSGPASLALLSGLGAEVIGDITLGEHGEFRCRAAGLEELSYKRGRLVIRVSNALGVRAEGYVLVSGFSSITRRLGIAGRHFFAVIAGSETPEDVAAMLAFFREDPSRFAELRKATAGSTESNAEPELESESVPVDALGIRSYAPEEDGEDGRLSRKRLRHFVGQILSAMRGTRGRLRTGEEEHDEGEGEGTDDNVAGEIESVPEPSARFSEFEMVLAECVKPGARAHDVLFGLDLANYICERLQPEVNDAKRWLQHLMAASERVTMPPDRQADVAACALALASAAPTAEASRIARARLLLLNTDLSVEAPSEEAAHGFLSVLPKQCSWPESWTSVRSCSTWSEQRRAFLDALKSGVPSEGYPDLPTGAPKEWPRLKRAVADAAAGRHVMPVEAGARRCPSCNVALPPSELAKLHSPGIATALGCCEKVLIVSGESV